MWSSSVRDHAVLRGENDLYTKRLPIILVISLLLISLAPACVAAGIKIEPIQGGGYHIEEMEHWIDDGKEKLNDLGKGQKHEWRWILGRRGCLGRR